MINPKSLQNLDPKARYMGKKRFNVTLLPDTIAWLSKGGNASQRIEELVTAARAGHIKYTESTGQAQSDREIISQLTAEVERLKKFEQAIETLKTVLSDTGFSVKSADRIF